MNLSAWSSDELRELKSHQLRVRRSASRAAEKFAKATQSVEYQIAGHEELLASLRSQYEEVIERIEIAVGEMRRFRLGLIHRMLGRVSVRFEGAHFHVQAQQIVELIAELRTEAATREKSICRVAAELDAMRGRLKQAETSLTLADRIKIGRFSVGVHECLELEERAIDEALASAISRERSRLSGLRWADFARALKRGKSSRFRLSKSAPQPSGAAKEYAVGQEPFLAPKVYVLRLEGGRYYVGRCKNFKVRITRHISGRGAKWTKMHRPVAVEAIFMGDVEEEKAVTLHYMAEHGINSVRGWVFCKGGMYDEAQIRFLIRGFAAPIPVKVIPRSSALRPQRLERHPDWEWNRHQVEEGPLHHDEQGY